MRDYSLYERNALRIKCDSKTLWKGDTLKVKWNLTSLGFPFFLLIVFMGAIPVVKVHGKILTKLLPFIAESHSLRSTSSNAWDCHFKNYIFESTWKINFWLVAFAISKTNFRSSSSLKTCTQLSTSIVISYAICSQWHQLVKKTCSVCLTESCFVLRS